jgi:hypothetical protein
LCYKKSSAAVLLTVENYLKAIFQAQLRLRAHGDLVPMGQLAARSASSRAPPRRW